MVDKVIENNRVSITGEIVSEFEFSHEVFGEGFYTVDVCVNRLSESSDIIPLMVSERLIDVKRDYRGLFVEAIGQFRSYNRHDGRNRNKLILSIFAREIEFTDNIGEYARTNQIYLDGFVCKPTVYRKTPLGREIADILIAVNRPYGKSDYIPCITWGRNARYCSKLEVGAHLKVWGRIQSREYTKKTEDGESIKKTAYEVSVSKIEFVDNEEC